MIRAAESGDVLAIRTLFYGYWPFVLEFEGEIDRCLPDFRKHLVKAVGYERAVAWVRDATEALRDMKREEGEHAHLWRSVMVKFDPNGWSLPSVYALITEIKDHTPLRFFCFLAGTELIAEELAYRLNRSAAFLAQVGKPWLWGEAHLKHDDVSHLDIDLDLARIFETRPDQIETLVERAMQMFWMASQDLWIAARTT